MLRGNRHQPRFEYANLTSQLSAQNRILTLSAAVAKTSQVVLGGATHGQFKNTIATGVDGVTRNIGALRVNLIAGVLSGAAAAQTTDMTGFVELFTLT